MDKKEFMNSAFYKPNVVQIEFVQGCNRRCSFCGTRGLSSELQFIDEEVLKKECKLIEASGYKPRILLSGHGENTLHPDFYHLVVVMRRLMPNAWIQIMTNGQSIRHNIKNLQKMFIAGINDVTIDEYSDSRFDMDEFIPELEELRVNQNIRVEHAIMGPGVPLYMPKNSAFRRLLLVPPIDLDEITMSRVLTNHCGAGAPPNTKKAGITCTKVFRELSFRWDGNVALCCQDFRGQYKVANVMDEGIETFDDLWRHPRLEAARRVLFHDKRTFFPCKICDTPALRPGLLPDQRGKQMMEQPTEKDYLIVNKRYPALSVMRRRPWEKPSMERED
jgi:uncharacterized radical SAM superfamily protein